MGFGTVCSLGVPSRRSSAPPRPWTGLGLATLAVLTSDGGLGWLQVDVVALAYLVVLGAGYGFKGLVAARTGRHFLGTGSDGAEAR